MNTGSLFQKLDIVCKCLDETVYLAVSIDLLGIHSFIFPFSPGAYLTLHRRFKKVLKMKVTFNVLKVKIYSNQNKENHYLDF